MAVDTIARALAIKAQQGGGSGETPDYQELTNKPSINGVTLEGNKTSADLGIETGVTEEQLTQALAQEAAARQKQDDLLQGEISDKMAPANVKAGIGIDIEQSGLDVTVSSVIYWDGTIDEDGNALAMFQKIYDYYVENNVLLDVRIPNNQNRQLFLKQCSISTRRVVFTFYGISALVNSYEDPILYRASYDVDLTDNILSNLSALGVNYFNFGIAHVFNGAVAYGGCLDVQNSESYTPTKDYNPATKKYVDDTIAGSLGLQTYVLTDNSATNPLKLWEAPVGCYLLEEIETGEAPLMFPYLLEIQFSPEAAVDSVYVGRGQPFVYFNKVLSDGTLEKNINEFGYTRITSLVGDKALSAEYEYYYHAGYGSKFDGRQIARVENVSVESGVNQTVQSNLTFINLPKSTVIPTEDSHFVNKKYVDDLVSTISTLSFQVVTELPTTDIQTNIIYLVPSTTSSEQNVYDEYIYINNAWEKIGSTAIDLSNYLAKDNTAAYTPTGDYNPATKQYVDSSVTNQATTEETISGLKTFTTLPESSVVPTTNNQLVNKAYVDSTLSTALGNINTILATLTTVSEVTE